MSMYHRMVQSRLGINLFLLLVSIASANPRGAFGDDTIRNIETLDIGTGKYMYAIGANKQNDLYALFLYRERPHDSQKLRLTQITKKKDSWIAQKQSVMHFGSGGHGIVPHSDAGTRVLVAEHDEHSSIVISTAVPSGTAGIFPELENSFVDFGLLVSTDKAKGARYVLPATNGSVVRRYQKMGPMKVVGGGGVPNIGTIAITNTGYVFRIRKLSATTRKAKEHAGPIEKSLSLCKFDHEQSLAWQLVVSDKASQRLAIRKLPSKSTHVSSQKIECLDSIVIQDRILLLWTVNSESPEMERWVRCTQVLFNEKESVPTLEPVDVKMLYRGTTSYRMLISDTKDLQVWIASVTPKTPGKTNVALSCYSTKHKCYVRYLPIVQTGQFIGGKVDVAQKIQLIFASKEEKSMVIKEALIGPSELQERKHAGRSQTIIDKCHKESNPKVQ
jgi:hypothetical protein